MIRKPAVAGIFYPKDTEALKKQVQSFLEQAEEIKLKRKLKALIVPHAGYVYSGIVAAQGYKLLEKQNFKKVILLGPSHYLNFYGVSIANEDFSTPLGIVKCGNTKAWLNNEFIQIMPEAHQAEHCLEVQLPFLQTVMKENNFEIYSLILGQVNAEELAKIIIPLLDNDTFLIVSSDLSHYLTYDKAIMKDNSTISKILKNDFNNLDACGQIPIKVLMHLSKLLGWKAELIDYRNSGDTAGDKSRVVGYCAIAYTK